MRMGTRTGNRLDSGRTRTGLRRRTSIIRMWGIERGSCRRGTSLRQNEAGITKENPVEFDHVTIMTAGDGEEAVGRLDGHIDLRGGLKIAEAEALIAGGSVYDDPGVGKHSNGRADAWVIVDGTARYQRL